MIPTNLLPRVTGSLVPHGTQIVDFMSAGLGSAPRQPINGSYRPAQQESCPTCNLIEIPFNASLPALRM